VTERSRLRHQSGQETLQAMLAVAFMLLPVLFGIIELSGLVHVWIGQQSAAAIGARVAGNAVKTTVWSETGSRLSSAPPASTRLTSR
jgi:Flp pilus assembly protein TadG